MGVETKIQWCHHTFNGWIGCTEAGPECDHCYAREQNKHWKWNGGEWGHGALRKITSSTKWREPLKWNAAAKEAGERRRVFAFSLADVADAEAPQDAYPFLWALVEACDWLDWLFLTKRPARIIKIVPEAWLLKPPRNVWWGTSVGTQKSADAMVPALLKTPAAIRFLSMEPLLGPVDLHFGEPLGADEDSAVGFVPCCGDARERHQRLFNEPCWRGINWVIVGGESGAGARPMRLEWARSIVEQCRAAGVSCFVKQLGARPAMDAEAWRALSPKPLLTPRGEDPIIKDAGLVQLAQTDRAHGGNIESWPADLRIREFPR